MFTRKPADEDLLRENAALKEQLTSIGKENADLRAENARLRGEGERISAQSARLHLAVLDERAVQDAVDKVSPDVSAAEKQRLSLSVSRTFRVIAEGVP